MEQIFLSKNSGTFASVVTDECGNGGKPIDVTNHEVFFNQAKVSLAKWTTQENLDFWTDATAEAFTYNLISMVSVLDVIYMNRGGE